jgi:hypothetical protein
MPPCLFSTCGVLTSSPVLWDISERQRTFRSTNCRRTCPIWLVKTGLWSWSVKPTADHPWQRSSFRRAGCRMYWYCGAGWNSGECSACQRAEKRSKRRNSCPTVIRSTRRSPGSTRPPIVSVQKTPPNLCVPSSRSLAATARRWTDLLSRRARLLGRAPTSSSAVRFALDSLLEEAGFELSVPPERKAFPRALDRFRRPSHCGHLGSGTSNVGYVA